MTLLRCPLAGSYFRPPASRILESLPVGATLQLEREDDNPYDEQAVRVMVDLYQIPESQHASLRENLGSSGADWDELLGQNEPFHLGYLAKEGGKPLEKARAVDPGVAGNAKVRAEFEGRPLPKGKLAFGMDGKPQVVVPLGSAGIPDDSGFAESQDAPEAKS